MNIKCRSRYKGEWQCTFVVTLDSSWMARYNYIFQGLSPSSLEIVRIIPYKKHEILSIALCRRIITTQTILSKKKNHTNDQHLACIEWESPQRDWIKLNCDGAVANGGEVLPGTMMVILFLDFRHGWIRTLLCDRDGSCAAGSEAPYQ